MSEGPGESRRLVGSEFDRATRDLIEGLLRNDVAAIAELASAQQASFEALCRDGAAARAPHAELDERLRSGQSALALAQQWRDELRTRLDLLRHARTRARRSRSADPAARFVSQRV